MIFVHQLSHPQEDTAVRGEGEIVLCKRFSGLGMGGIVQQNRAQDRAFGMSAGR